MSDTNLVAWLVSAPLVLAFVCAFLRWLLTPPTWRDFEGPLLDEGERFATDFRWWRWLIDLLFGRFWRW